MVSTFSLNRSVASSLFEFVLQVAQQRGLVPEQYRVQFALAFAVVSIGGLGLLAYKMRTADAEPEDREVSSKLERRDLLDGREPTNTLERVVQVANKRETYAVGIVGMFALSVLALVLDRNGVGVLLLFGCLLFALKAFLRFGWSYVDAFSTRHQPDERDPDSIRFQGFTRDVSTFLILFVVTTVALLLLIGVEMLIL